MNDIDMRKLSELESQVEFDNNLVKQLQAQVDQLQAQITEYKGDREFFQQRDMEQCREISRNHIKIEELKAQVAALKEIANQKLCSEMPLSEMDVGEIEESYDYCILTARIAINGEE